MTDKDGGHFLTAKATGSQRENACLDEHDIFSLASRPMADGRRGSPTEFFIRHIGRCNRLYRLHDAVICQHGVVRTDGIETGG